MTSSLHIPDLALVVLVGPSGSGKSTFARKFFTPLEIVSSDWCRAAVSDDEASQEASRDAFDLMHFIMRRRLKWGRLTVADATHLHPKGRGELLDLAWKYDVPAIALIFNLPEDLCIERAQTRTERPVPEEVVARQYAKLQRSLEGIAKEGFARIIELRTVEEVDAITEIIRTAAAQPAPTQAGNEQPAPAEMPSHD